jgi:hypothetical protein
LFVEDHGPGHAQPREDRNSLGIQVGVAELNGPQSVGGEGAEEVEGWQDLAATKRVDETSPRAGCADADWFDRADLIWLLRRRQAEGLPRESAPAPGRFRLPARASR